MTTGPGRHCCEKPTDLARLRCERDPGRQCPVTSDQARQCLVTSDQERHCLEKPADLSIPTACRASQPRPQGHERHPGPL